MGIPLAEIKRALDRLPAARTPTKREWQRLAAGWAGELDARIEALRQLRDEFTGCIGCGCLSLTGCTLANPGDRLGTYGPGPRRLIGTPDAPAVPQS